MINIRILLAALLFLAMLFVGCSGEKAPEVAKDGDYVSVHYTGMLEDGSIFDSSEGREPLGFVLGEGQMIQGFENAIRGMQVGESKTVTIPAEEAYGPRNEEMVFDVDITEIPEDLDYGVGSRLNIELNDGSIITVTVVAITETSVTLDANHQLAGKDLTFEIELVAIRS